jgi:hypothetical protein
VSGHAEANARRIYNHQARSARARERYAQQQRKAYELSVERREARAASAVSPLHMRLVEGERRDCQRVGACLSEVMRAKPTAEHASCPPGCAAFTPIDRHIERHIAMVGRGDGGAVMVWSAMAPRRRS